MLRWYVITVTTGWKNDGGLTHLRRDNFVDFGHGHALLMSGENKYDAEVVVGIKRNGEYVFDDVVEIAPIAFVIKKEESSTTATTGNPIGDIHEDSFGSILAQDGGNVKHSLRDSDDLAAENERLKADVANLRLLRQYDAQTVKGVSAQGYGKHVLSPKKENPP